MSDKLYDETELSEILARAVGVYDERRQDKLDLILKNLADIKQKLETIAYHA